VINRAVAKVIALEQQQALPVACQHFELAAAQKPKSISSVIVIELLTTSPQVEVLRQQQAQLVAQRDRELAAMEAGMAHNAALIEERDQGIREISRQIVEVNEMFQDLAVLINDQGVQVRGLLNRLCKREPKP
jgi:uncharacterized protein involved in exopolysaccharide biosynthesis